MNILFVTSTRIGDAVLSCGLLSHLLATHADARITVACGVLPAPLFRAISGVESVIPLTKKALSAHWLDLWAQTVTTRWDLVVDLRASALAWMLLARRRRVMRRADPKQKLHRVEELAALFDLRAIPAPCLWSSTEDVARASALIPDGAPVIGLGVTANWAPKIWPAERFVALAKGLTRADGILPGARIAVFGGPDEQALAEPVLSALGQAGTINMVSDHGLAVTAAALARCSLFIGNDSGLMHLSAAADVPTVGLFGPSPAERYGPWGDHCAVVEADTSYANLVGAPDFDHLATENLMQTLSVEAVEDAVTSLWHHVRIEEA
jgi:ADP-heptose:LPS heptosyltransferase